MKITSISCDQFAGVRNRNISFTDGINIIYGKNESGKSTLVNLISRTLFQAAKIDGRSHKDFPELYYPSARKGGGFISSSADGKIVFETEKGTYTLSKVWGDGESCVLSTPDGIFRSPSQIEEILKDALTYGEGVYADLLFSSQRNTDISLQTILDASKKSDAKQELVDVVSQAFAESDGIPLDAIEEAIAAQIEALAGKHWDYERDMPVRKAGGGRYTKQAGAVLEAYYAWEDAKEAFDAISKLENAADHAARICADQDAAVRLAENAYNRFNQFFRQLTLHSERSAHIESLRQQLDSMQNVLTNWPQLCEKLEKAKALQTELESRKVLDLWAAITAAKAHISEEDYAIAELPCPDSAEIAKANKLQQDITRLENKLCGMNLNAAIQMLDGHEVQIKSLRTGEVVDITGGIASITEAVELIVPGVIEMQLSPKDVDVASVEEQIAQRKDIVAGIFAKYKVETLDAMEAYAKKISDTKTKIQLLTAKMTSILGGLTMSQLEAQYQAADRSARPMAEIDRDILSLCNDASIDAFIIKTATVVEGYETEHGSISALKVTAFDLNEALKTAEASIGSEADIPEEYLSIGNPEVHLQNLLDAVKAAQELQKAAFEEKAGAASRLATYQEAHPDACQETVDGAYRVFAECKTLLGHWLHIQEVFLVQKENINNNPMQDLADRFAHYLNVISGGSVSSEFPEGDKLNMRLYSGNSLLNYGKLSEGTKDTVSLAFRLAVLDHLFPEGGGVIVFDDPFTDMDAERTAQSCALLQECAKRHQVIFLSCKEEYCTALQGNRIDIY